MFTTHYSAQRHYGYHILWFFSLVLQCRTPYAVEHSLALLKMGITMPKTCWDRSLIINIRSVASCWFLSLHPGRCNITDSMGPHSFQLCMSCLWTLGSTKVTRDKFLSRHPQFWNDMWALLLSGFSCSVTINWHTRVCVCVCVCVCV